jgi:hypothetical protein
VTDTTKEIDIDDPMNFYDEFNEWLQAQPELRIGNGDMLIKAFENPANYHRFLEEKYPHLL